MPKRKLSMLDYPLLSGKPLKDATKKDLFAEASTNTEMETIIDAIAVTGIEEFVLTETEKARRLAAYLTRIIELAPARKLARASDE
ncbi:hypothetical protein [Bradyrhizobium sp. USDA 10063]